MADRNLEIQARLREILGILGDRSLGNESLIMEGYRLINRLHLDPFHDDCPYCGDCIYTRDVDDIIGWSHIKESKAHIDCMVDAGERSVL